MTSDRRSLFLLLTLAVAAMAGGSDIAAQGAPTPVLTETQKFVAADGVAYNEFNRIAIDGEYALIGAPGANDRGFQAGKAYIFQFIAGRWEQNQVLLPVEVESGDSFGNVVALGGGSAFIYAGDSRPPGGGQGAVYHYRLEGTTWIQQPTIFAPDASQQDLFGESLSTDGSWLAVGSPGDDDAGADFGTVYIYQRTDSIWNYHHKIIPTGLGTLERFGSNTSIRGNHLLVSSIGNSRVFGYDLSTETGEFEFLQQLTRTDGGALSGKVAVDGDTALVGAAERFIAGAAYVFKHDGANWVEDARLEASDGGDPSFGSALALHGNILVIGALLTSFGSVARGGQAYIFQRPSTASPFAEVNRLLASDPQSFDFLGRSVAVGSSNILVGSSADQNGDGAGAVYYFQIANMTPTATPSTTASATASPSATSISSPTADLPRRKTIIFLQGINTSFAGTESTDYGTFNDLRDHLASHYGYYPSDFLMYSYLGGVVNESTGRWQPNSYDKSHPTEIDFTVEGIRRLHRDLIIPYHAAHPDTTFVLVGHSLGGVVAMEEVLQNIVAPDYERGLIGTVITVDSPLLGIPKRESGHLLIDLAALIPFGHGRNFVGPAADQLVAMHDAEPATSESLTEAVAQAKNKGVTVVTVGNTEDCVWLPSRCGLPVPGALSTQWLFDGEAVVNVFTVAPPDHGSRILNAAHILRRLITSHSAVLDKHFGPVELATIARYIGHQR